MEQPTQNKASKISSLIKTWFLNLSWITWTISAFIATLGFVFVKQVVFDIIIVNDNSMSGTLNMGDAVLVKNCLNNYQKGHIVSFNFPVQDSTKAERHCLMRVVALPGDSLELIDQQVYVNNTILTEWQEVKHNYFIKTKGMPLDSEFIHQYNLFEGGSVSNSNDYSFSLTKKECETLKKDSLITSVKLKIEKKGFPDLSCFPSEAGFSWNMDQFGKIYIPKKQDTLYLDTITVKLYNVIINGYEKSKLEINSDTILIDGKVSTYYVVKQNYYFVLGDNRGNAIDSRVWGFLPENFINGRVIMRVKKSNP